MSLPSFFIPPATFFHTPGPYIPPGFAVPLWERGRRADAVLVFHWEGTAVCFVFFHTLRHFIPPVPFISYPPALPDPFGKGMGACLCCILRGDF